MLSDYFNIQKTSPGSASGIRVRLVSILAAAALFIYLSPLEYLFDKFGYHHTNGCPLLTFAGVPCPLCGTGRTVKAFINFDFRNLFYFNPAAPVFLFFGLFLFSFMMVLSFKNLKLVPATRTLKLWIIPVLLLIIVWFLNILFGHHYSSL